MTAQERVQLSDRPSKVGRQSSRKVSTLARMGFVHKSGVPRNPVGRTGMHGRGLLGRYGANFAADPIVTRRKPTDPTVLQMVTITRRDTGELAIPGGMVEYDETVSQTLRKEFYEEALRSEDSTISQGSFDVRFEIPIPSPLWNLLVTAVTWSGWWLEARRGRACVALFALA